MNVVPLGPEPAKAICPSCGAKVTTRIEHRANTRTHMIALFLCIVCCWLCTWVPYCVDSCRNANHYCPSCNSYLGVYQA